MIDAQLEAIKPYAKKYIWWKTPEEALAYPLRVVAQVMDIGDYEDMNNLAVLLGDDLLREVLAHTEASWFRPRSWCYWHYQLSICGLGEVPSLPIWRFM